MHRNAPFASKLAPTEPRIPVGASLLAINDNAVCLMHRSAPFAGKPRSNEPRIPVGASLLAINDNAV
jgi:hypothetical protein